ncbi:hypothetical protein SSS_10863 [Sarcoptes scabiei]|nr:hypothetical protein SSS_10863 [Sarcoptes scabiei]
MFRSLLPVEPKSVTTNSNANSNIVSVGKSSKMSDEVNQNIQVFVRCRPLKSLEKKGPIEIISDKRAIRAIQHNKTYAFDNVFDSKANQLDVYRSVVEPLVEQVIEGYNCTVFAYGQTGTGKTYTMVGNHSNDDISWEDDPLSGIIPRAIDQLIDDLQNQNTEYTICVSFLELYNEDAYDLLSPLSDTSKLRIYNDSEKKGSVIISGLVELIVKTKSEIFEILEKGSLKRQTAPTLMNACSSRSHSIFSITVRIKETTFDGEEVVKMGKLNLVDLAGSENIGRSGAVEERAREASNINKSLLTLGRVITSLVEKSSHIPYRDSKLTRLLQDSLGGKTKTSIIATISPCSDDIEDTISTLDYAQRAKKIMNKPEINLKMTKKTLIAEYLTEIDRLRRDLEAARDKKGIYVDPKNYALMEATLKNQEQNLDANEAKIEQMKQELDRYTLLLTEANENISSKDKELSETREKIDDLSKDLNQTRQTLQSAYQKIVEQKIIIEAREVNETKLLAKTKELVELTDQCVDHNEKLHDKVAKISSLADLNLNSFAEFKTRFLEQMNQVTFFNNSIFQTLSSGFHSLDGIINDNREEVLKHESNIETNFSSIESEVDRFVTEFLLMSDKIITINELQAKDLRNLVGDFKKNITDKFQNFSNNMIGKKNSIITTLDNLIKQSSINHSVVEELILTQMSRFDSSSKNLLQSIQSIDEDYQSHYVQQCLSRKRKINF